VDARAQLALMTKAKLVFESPDTFLSFPAVPPAYPPDALTFLPVAHDMMTFSEFSELTNALPAGSIFQPALDNLLWSVYLHVLKNAVLAQGTLTADQQQALQNALSVLQTQGPDGSPAPSPHALAYNQYQQAYIRAMQNYKAQQLTAQAATDPSAVAQWTNVDDPALRAQVAAAESDWENKGYKAQVEQAKQVQQSCVAQSPAMQWQTWLAQCNPDIDFLTDPANQSFAPTVFMPYDIVSQNNWQSFTMSGAEIQQLASQAPPELGNVVGAVPPNSVIDSLSFEFCSAALSRPWFDSNVFAARFWKLADATEQLSDGNVPPKGSWPAYVTAVVFARNISVTTHNAGGPPLKQSLTSFPVMAFHPAIVAAAPVTPPHPINAAPVVHPQPMISHPQFMGMKPGAVAKSVPPPTPMMTARPPVMMRLNAAAYTAHPMPASTPAPPAPTTQPDTGQISILAYVCKRLPKCPNPDPNLNWGEGKVGAVVAAVGDALGAAQGGGGQSSQGGAGAVAGAVGEIGSLLGAFGHGGQNKGGGGS